MLLCSEHTYQMWLWLWVIVAFSTYFWIKPRIRRIFQVETFNQKMCNIIKLIPLPLISEFQIICWHDMVYFRECRPTWQLHLMLLISPGCILVWGSTADFISCWWTSRIWEINSLVHIRCQSFLLITYAPTQPRANHLISLSEANWRRIWQDYWGFNCKIATIHCLHSMMNQTNLTQLTLNIHYTHHGVWQFEWGTCTGIQSWSKRTASLETQQVPCTIIL